MQYLLTTLTALRTRFLPSGELLCVADGMETPDVYTPPPGVDPLFTLGRLETDGLYGKHVDLSGRQILADGLEQGVNGLVLPGGLLTLGGAFPSENFWPLTDSTMEEYPSHPTKRAVTAVMHKITNNANYGSGARRIIGWSDGASYFGVGVADGNWKVFYNIGSKINEYNLGGADVTPVELSCNIIPSSNQFRLTASWRNLDATGNPETAPAGGGFALNSIDLFSVSEFFSTFSNPADWKPFVLVNGYDSGDDPWAILSASFS